MVRDKLELTYTDVCGWMAHLGPGRGGEYGLLAGEQGSEEEPSGTPSDCTAETLRGPVKEPKARGVEFIYKVLSLAL